MSKLTKYTLKFSKQEENWKLQEDKTKKEIKTFQNKENAIKGGVLKKLLGKEGGSVKIQKQNGEFQQERTYPLSKDPRKSKG